MRSITLLRAILLAGCGALIVIALLLSRPRPNQDRSVNFSESNGVDVRPVMRKPEDEVSLGEFDRAVRKLRAQAQGDFQKLGDRFGVFGTNTALGDVHVQVSARTNAQGNVVIELEVQGGGYAANFVAGPLDSRGFHRNPYLAEGALFSQFFSLRESSDTRRYPEAANDWYKSTGTWSNPQAVEEALRLAKSMGHDVSRVARHEIAAVPMTVRNQAGEEVKVTPFYKVDLYDSKDTRILGAEFRIQTEPPGKIVKCFNWPPIKLP